jgi:pimeloyl-ACP methyl ester carboxylesterase
MSIQNRSFILPSGHLGKPITADVTFVADGKIKPVIIFIHGFKGFKDWGTFPLIATTMAEAGFVFVKLNLSHNGTTPEHPTDFADLEAFGHNTFSIELDDIGRVIDAIETSATPIPAGELNNNQVLLMGHSRGGGLAILKAAEDQRIQKIVTWAAISTLDRPWGNMPKDEWKSKGVQYIQNSRTKQNMPLYYQLYEDFLEHKDRLDIRQATQNLTTPLLVIHGDADETVPLQMAYDLYDWHEHGLLHLIKGAGHTFGGVHPFTATELPDPTKEAVQASIDFFRKQDAVADTLRW